jgi:hypothetical protein
MTTGKACASDMDCVGPAGSAGTNRCSSDFNFTITGVKVEIYPTPICLPIVTMGQQTFVASCDPAPSNDPMGNLIHFCDGPDSPSSTGICIPNNPQQPLPMQGVCLPKCSFQIDGSKPAGCPGNDTCVPFTFELDNTTGTVSGFGYCYGSCANDSECAGLPPVGDAGPFVCQKDIGFCTNAPVARGVDGGAGSIGSPCTRTQGDPSDGGVGLCNCEYSPSTLNGYCTQSCVVGDPNSTCPEGYVCDNGSPPVIDFGDAGSFKLTAQNPKTPGLCIPKCTVPDSGVGVDGGPQCPEFSQCLNVTLQGPDCLFSQ